MDKLAVMGIVCALHINRKVRLHIEETMRDNYVTVYRCKHFVQGL